MLFCAGFLWGAGDWGELEGDWGGGKIGCALAVPFLDDFAPIVRILRETSPDNTVSPDINPKKPP